MSKNRQPNTNNEDYSPAKTLIKFDNPIPLLRHPIKSPLHNYSPILCFKSPKSFASSYLSCESNITQQCEAGARIACSETASRNCAPPWWKTLIPNNNGLSKQQELMEREKCEEREMEQCLDSAKLSCRKFAEDKCLPAFRDARVVVESGGWNDGDVKKSVVGLIGNVCFGEKSCVKGYELGKSSWSDIRSRIGVRIVRGSDLLDKEFR